MFNVVLGPKHEDTTFVVYPIKSFEVGLGLVHNNDCIGDNLRKVHCLAVVTASIGDMCRKRSKGTAHSGAKVIGVARRHE